MKRLLLLLSLIIAAPSAQAVTGNPFIYSKTVLKIVPAATPEAPPPAPEPQRKDAGAMPLTSEAALPRLKRAPKEFTVDIRPKAFLEQKDFIMRQPFTDREGMLIPVDPPAPAQVNATRMIDSADVLLADEDGIITAIAPRLKLSGLTEAVGSSKPIRAFIYLKAGAAETNDIRVGDRIEGSFFRTHPVVIQ